MKHIPRKRFGQHFLTDQRVIADLVNAIAPAPFEQCGERLVEIGPGLGALTLPVLQRCRSLDVVELDRDVIPLLQRITQGHGELRIHQADALQFDFATLSQQGERLRAIGNLPYNISTPLMFHLFAQRLGDQPLFADMTFMLQLEVCQRLAAEPNSAHYGRLSVMAQYHAHIELLFGVPPEAFDPPPKVDSAIVQITPYLTPPVEVGDKQVFDRLVALAFNARRKTLRNGLKGILAEADFARAGVDAQQRAETLSLHAFAALSRVASGM